MRPPRSDQGLSLMELVVALAVFALVATMGLQALTGTLRQRDRLVALDAGTATLSTALSLLRADLRAGVPLIFHAPDGTQASAWSIDPNGQGFALTVSGQRNLDAPGGPSIGWVVWRYDPGPGHLTRATWATSFPANPSAQTPAVVVAKGIAGIELRSFHFGRGWITGPDPVFTGPSSSLPQAIEVVVTTDQLGRVSTLVGNP